MPIALRYAARSDVGLIRANNQDSGYAGPHLLVIADGMGGHAGGDIASSLAVAELAALDGESIGSQEAQSRLAKALRGANGRLLDRVVADPVLAGMGTTVTAILRAGSRLIVAHIGDSRAYRLRDGEFVQVTSDHTYVQRLVTEGSLTPEEAEHHPQRSVLMRVLTGEHGDEPDLSVSEGRPGDRWLLCSDGLSGVVSAETIADTLAQVADPAAAATRLVQLALRAGGPDNVTVIVADVVDLDQPPSTTPQIVGAAANTDPTRAVPAAVAGEARGRTAGRERDGDTPAGRAAMLTREGGLADRGGRSRADDAERGRLPRRGTGWGWWLFVTAVVVVLLAAGFGGWRWSQGQYFVGEDSGFVAVYRGLPQDVASFQLSSVSERTDIAVEDLPQFTQDRLAERIVVDDRARAEAVVAEMRAQADRGSSP